ncbi:hypothetical protein R3P38DRAFT_3174815 [Favolaschia claudopus]|uniref:Uncharacterized protein n=1 Tax=Favolaschia claudopus TaxID=2862362 RepID=A0AAW0DBS5_9AGAR
MSRFIWFVIGAGIGSWWTAHKSSRFDVDCRFQRSLPAPAPSAPAGSSDQKAPLNNSEPPAYPAPYNRDWDQERARIRQFSRNAEDTVTELSEATLNTILQATEALKAKMAEHRALREQERLLEEDRRRNPPRLV